MKYLILALFLVYIHPTAKESNPSNSSLFNRFSNTLENKKILITTPPHYASRLAYFIKEKGGIPMVVSTIESLCNPQSKTMTHILENPGNYDYVVLPSRKAINCFMLRAEELNINKYILKSMSICAIGKDIDYLKNEYDLQVVFEPKEPSPEGIKNRLSEINNVQQKSIAVVSPKVIELTEPDVIPDFLNGLKKLGMNVTKAEGYITQPASTNQYNEELQAIRQNNIDFIAFTSSAEIEGLIQMVGDVKWINQNTVACFGPYTAQNAKKLGVKVDLIGQDYHSFMGFVEAMEQYVKNSQ
jgi:uroporphyrinogen-III synthase